MPIASSKVDAPAESDRGSLMTDRTEILNGLFVGLPDALASDLFIIATNQQRPIEDVIEQFLLQSIQRWIDDHPIAAK